MHIFSAALLVALGASLAHGADDVRQVPSSPDTWSGDLVERIEPTASCPGGTPQGLRKHMSVSGAFDSPQAFHAAVKEELPALRGILSGDVFHQFHFHAELPGSSFWGFSGYAIVRAGCIVHAEITSHDN